MGGQLPCPGPAARGQKCILRDKHGIHTLGREAVVLAPMVEHFCPPAGQTLGILPASSSSCLLQQSTHRGFLLSAAGGDRQRKV